MAAPGALASLFGPPRCTGCGARVALLCHGCAAGLARPAPASPIPHVAGVVAPWVYEGAARSLVLALKVRGLRAAARPLVAGMLEAVTSAGVEAGVVVWVPGRRGDIRRRGYDHAAVLARGVGRGLGLPARPLLRRSREPPDQASLSGAARRRNLMGAFSAAPCRVPVLLVDDVVTTGATAASCAGVLRRAGAPSVEVLAACRT